MKNRLYKLRTQNDMTQEQLAEKIGVQKAAISKYENGKLDIPNSTLVKLSNIFDCSVDYLLGESNLISSEEEYFKAVRTAIVDCVFNDYIEDFQKIGLSDNSIKIIYDSCIYAFNPNNTTPNPMERGMLLTKTSPNIDFQKFMPLLDSLNKRLISMNTHFYRFVPYFEDIDINSYEDFDINMLNSVGASITSSDLKKLEDIMLKINSSFFPNCKLIKNKNGVSSTEDDRLFLIPVLGKIAAGQPILAEEYLEGYLQVDPNIHEMTTSDDYFYLKVSDESMNLKVHNGDYALIHKQDYAENGDIIVAIVNGDDEATLKRYKKLNEQFILLEPMSTDPTIETITVDLKETKFQIIGKAIGQFGKF